MARPVGITIIALLNWYVGFLIIYQKLSFIADPSSLLMLLLSAFPIIVGWGLWHLKDWAWMMALILSIFSLTLGLVQLFLNPVHTTGTLINLGISVTILFYLFSTPVKKAFQH